LHLSASDGCVPIKMSTSRIEVPFTLPPPHFDDDATIATARQVVPIKGGRKIEGRRKVLTLFPLLIASTLCGALGAIAVNYLERRPVTAPSVTQQQSVPSVSTQAKTEPPPVSMAAELNAKNTETPAAVQPDDAAVTRANEASTKSEAPKIEKRENEERKSAPVAPVKGETAPDAAKLVRKRRVQPADSEIPVRRNRRAAAGRIEDLFTGPNP
jgi:hypothetical protein